ncbi:MAG: type I-E CRISPR-associated protein Cse1/CasA [Agrobacterium albertimagni]
MPFNLINEPWLPVVPTGGGERRWIRPAEVAEAGDVEFAWGRADLNIATYELLIGLLSIAFPPKDDDDWLVKLDTPPSVAELDSAFAPLVPWFNLDGDGPRFMQDYEGFEGERLNCDQLFVDGPGDETIEAGKDLFRKDQIVMNVSRPAAAIMLYALQSHTPGAGRGHYSSLKGKMPLVVLVSPTDKHPELWRTLWSNVDFRLELSDEHVDFSTVDSASRVLPWCTAAHRGHHDLGRSHALHMFFGMPMRLRLEFQDAEGVCPILGGSDHRMVSGYRRKNSGISYDAHWRHSLVPYLVSSKATEAVSLNRRRVTYEYWAGILFGFAEFNKRGQGLSPPSALTKFRTCTRSRIIPFSVHIFGFVNPKKNAKIVDVAEAVVPAFASLNEDCERALVGVAHNLVGATRCVVDEIKDRIIDALIVPNHAGARPKSAVRRLKKSDAVLDACEYIVIDTEQPFRAALARIAAREHADADALDTAVKAECEAWITVLRGAALEAFDRAVPPETLINKRPSEQKAMIEARKRLVMMFDGNKLRESLGLAPVLPKTKKVKRSGRRAA